MSRSHPCPNRCLPSQVMPRPPDPTLPKCPTRSGSSVRQQGTYGNPSRRIQVNEKPHFLLDGSRTYTPRKHPVPPRGTG